MAAITTPKSILKKTPYRATSGLSKEERDRELAIYHANILQERKDIELKILLDTETLIDYPPASKPYDASTPSPADARSFKDLIRSFQPSDYDALIVERNINEHCGYALCPNNRVKDGAAGKYRLIGKYGKAKDFKVVEKEELEKWCSDACAKRAMFVRVQLSETPAWERESAQGVEIELLDEPESREEQIADGIENMRIDAPFEPSNEQNAAYLTLERGDKGLAAHKGLVDVTIRERDPKEPAQPSSIGTEDLSERLNTLHLALEGHIASFGSERQRRHHEESAYLGDRDGAGTDWEI